MIQVHLKLPTVKKKKKKNTAEKKLQNALSQVIQNSRNTYFGAESYLLLT